MRSRLGRFDRSSRLGYSARSRRLFESNNINKVQRQYEKMQERFWILYDVLTGATDYERYFKREFGLFDDVLRMIDETIARYMDNIEDPQNLAELVSFVKGADRKVERAMILIRDFFNGEYGPGEKEFRYRDFNDRGHFDTGNNIYDEAMGSWNSFAYTVKRL